MSVFEHVSYDDHEQVVFCRDAASGLRAIIAIHNTNLGPSLGGCRMWPYASEAEALNDVLRLSRGMTYKSALANLKLGGGKSVIIGDPKTEKTPELLRALGRYVESLSGRYIIAEDSGTGVPDMKLIAEETLHVSGIKDKATSTGESRSGDPSPATAHGVFVGMRAAVNFQFGDDSFDGIKVAIQGVGSVGHHLVRQLTEAGAQVWVCDIHEEPLQRVAAEFGANIVRPNDIFGLDVDVFAPCAMGAILNDNTIPQLKAKVVAGAANNQLAEDRHAVELKNRGILYAPDYAINSGGVIDVYYEREEYEAGKVLSHIESVFETLMEIFERARNEDKATSLVADAIARERFMSTKRVATSVDDVAA